MDDKPKFPWRLATNERYRDVVKHLTTLATASLLLPGFFAKEFLSPGKKELIKPALGWPIFWSWGLLGVAIFSGIVFHYLSAKWVRLAWGQETDVLGTPVSDSFIEGSLHLCFWTTAASFLAGLVFALAFMFGYGTPS